MPLTVLEAQNLPEIGTGVVWRLTMSHYGTESPHNY